MLRSVKLSRDRTVLASLRPHAGSQTLTKCGNQQWQGHELCASDHAACADLLNFKFHLLTRLDRFRARNCRVPMESLFLPSHLPKPFVAGDIKIQNCNVHQQISNFRRKSRWAWDVTGSSIKFSDNNRWHEEPANVLNKSMCQPTRASKVS